MYMWAVMAVVHKRKAEKAAVNLKEICIRVVFLKKKMYGLQLPL